MDNLNMNNFNPLNFQAAFRLMLEDEDVIRHLADYVASHADYVADRETALEQTVRLLSADIGRLGGFGLDPRLLQDQLRSYLNSGFFSSLISLLEAVSPVDRSLHSLYPTYQENHPGHFINRERIINYLSSIKFDHDNSINIPAIVFPKVNDKGIIRYLGYNGV